MQEKFAVALMSGDTETILGVFDTIEEADEYGRNHPRSHSEGLQYCFSAPFVGNCPIGTCVSIYGFYNA